MAKVKTEIIVAKNRHTNQVQRFTVDTWIIQKKIKTDGVNFDWLFINKETQEMEVAKPQNKTATPKSGCGCS